ncbi:MAG: fumarate hydratase [Caldicoprobacterales bacterium]|jgi:fumarate hydratase subunit alpha|nr:fumarate hydratase [Clostridiales bacterium]
MREINTSVIAQTVEQLYIQACYHIGEDVKNLLDKARKTEESPVGKWILQQLLDNIDASHREQLPLCQDTGMAVVFIELGQDVHITGGSLTEAVNEGVRRGCRKGYLRKSVLSPLKRENTGDNTPAVLHLELTEGNRVKITVSPKGFGSENMSRLAMLKPADGIEGIKNFVLDTVVRAGANPCPPIIVGIGIGGTMEKAAFLAKKALLREAGRPNPDPDTAGLEREILHNINATGIGPQGMGGRNTALAVHIDTFPTHLAGLPVAVNIQCHAARHAQKVI